MTEQGGENAIPRLSAQDIQQRFGILPGDKSPTVQALIRLFLNYTL